MGEPEESFGVRETKHRTPKASNKPWSDPAGRDHISLGWRHVDVSLGTIAQECFRDLDDGEPSSDSTTTCMTRLLTCSVQGSETPWTILRDTTLRHNFGVGPTLSINRGSFWQLSLVTAPQCAMVALERRSGWQQQPSSANIAYRTRCLWRGYSPSPRCRGSVVGLTRGIATKSK